MAGYEVALANNAVEGLRQLTSIEPDVIVADILMPHMDGFEFCQLVQKMSRASIMLLSGLGSEQDKVRGLELGADDYVVKPVGRDEFLARIAALIRRRARPSTAPYDDNRYRDDVLTIDKDRHEVWVGGKRTEFTPTQFKLLSFLAWRAGAACQLNEILFAVWDEPRPPLGVVRWHVSRLREKVEEDPKKPERIITIRGVGFRYDPP